MMPPPRLLPHNNTKIRRHCRMDDAAESGLSGAAYLKPARAPLQLLRSARLMSSRRDIRSRRFGACFRMTSRHGLFVRRPPRRPIFGFRVRFPSDTIQRYFSRPMRSLPGKLPRGRRRDLRFRRLTRHYSFYWPHTQRHAAETLQISYRHTLPSASGMDSISCRFRFHERAA